MNPLPKQPGAHVLIFTLVAALVLLSGCSKRSEQDRVLEMTVERYDRVRAGMSKQEVIALLGEPPERREGVYRWNVAGRPPNNASIEVKFNGEERVTSIARSRAQN